MRLSLPANAPRASLLVYQTVAIAKLLNQVEERIIGEMQAIKAKHGKEDAAITAAFEKDLAASEAKVAAKRKMFDEATKLHSAATEQLRNMEKKLASAEGELAMAKSEKQAADGKATTDRDLDLKNNAANRDEALLLINNERNLIASIKTLLSQLNSGKKIPLATNQAAVPAATGGADMVPAAAGKRAS